MSEVEDFERVEYGKLSEGQSGADYQDAQNSLRVEPHCSHDECTNSVEDPAEPAWVKLMSAVPQATQIDGLHAAREGTMMLPPGQTIKSMVASIRPQPEADYALDSIREQWIEFQEAFEGIRPKLEQGLTALSGSWKGDDFDGFEEQTETVLKNCKTIVGDISGEDGKGGVVKLLDDKQLDIYEQQGGTACVYPAPKFYMQGTSCGSHQIHIRPPFFKTCEVHKNDEIKKAVELAGFDPTVIDEVQEGRESRYNTWMEYVTANPEYEEGGLKGEELARKKADEYADQRLIALGAEGSDQLEEEAARVNEEVTERHANVEAHVQEIEPDVRKGEATTFNDGLTDKPDSGGLDLGDGGGMPDLGGGDGMGDMGGMESPNDYKPLTDGSGGFNGGNGSATFPGSSDTGGNLNGLGDENPFSQGLNDPDDLTGSAAPPGGYNGGNGLDSLGGNGLPLSGDYSGSGFNGTGSGLPPGGYTGGDGLNGLDDNPWNSSLNDPDDLDGGLAGGSGLGTPAAPPSGINTGPGLTGTGPNAFLPNAPSGPRKLDSGKSPGLSSPYRKGGTGSTGPRKLDSGRSSGLSSGSGKGFGGSGAPPGSVTKGSGLGSGSGSGGGRGFGAGAGAGAAGAGAGAGGRGAAGAGGMIAPGGGGAGGGRPGEDQESERQFWIAEDEDVWGGGPEDEEEDPYA